MNELARRKGASRIKFQEPADGDARFSPPPATALIRLDKNPVALFRGDEGAERKRIITGEPVNPVEPPRRAASQQENGVAESSPRFQRQNRFHLADRSFPVPSRHEAPRWVPA